MRKTAALRRSYVDGAAAAGRDISQISAGRTAESRDLARCRRVVQDLFFWRVSWMIAANVSIKLVVHSTRNKYDLRAVGRIGRIRIERRTISQSFCIATIGGDRKDVAAVRRPCNICDRAAVRRPSRHEFAFAAGRHATWSARRKIHHVKPAKCRKSNTFAVRRNRRIANKASVDGRTVVDAIVEMRTRADLGLDINGEWNIGRLAGREIDAGDFAVDGHDQRFAVGHEGVARIGVAGCTRFLIVAGHIIHEPAFLIGVEIADAKRSFGLVPRRVDHVFSIRRQDGPHGTSLSVRNA